MNTIFSRLICAGCCFALLLAPGCGGAEEGSEQNQSEDNQDQPDDPEELCEAACDAVYDGCELGFENDDGTTMSQRICEERCLEEDKFRGGQWCVATEAECTDDPQDMIDACLPDDYYPEACSHLGAWSREFIELEEQVVDLINDHRGQGATCGDEQLGAVDALEHNELLRCAARLHSIYMVEETHFSNTNADGEDAHERIENVGYTGETTYGNVNSGLETAEQLVIDWMDDADDCQTLMRSDFDHIGVGRYELRTWTMKFGGGG